jgi:histidinol-phosphate aminotransferase
MFQLDDLIQPHLRGFKPYSTARDDYKGKDGVFFDANENSLGSVTTSILNRYPDPYQLNVKRKIAEFKEIEVEQLFLGNGSDEAIDLLIRLFGEPSKDNIIICPPTYGMYGVSAVLNNIAIKKINLDSNFQLNLEGIQKNIDSRTKIIFICSPNNPTGNLIHSEDIRILLKSFEGIVVIDEAYIDFADEPSWVTQLNKYPNLIVLQTFSKAWGLAGLRLGMAIASKEIIALMNAIKPPYNINLLTQQQALLALENTSILEQYISKIKENKNLLIKEILKLSIVQHIYPSDSNFILVKFERSDSVFEHLIANKLITRLRNKEPLCGDAIRITIGTESENAKLLECLNSFS